MSQPIYIPPLRYAQCCGTCECHSRSILNGSSSCSRHGRRVSDRQICDDYRCEDLQTDDAGFGPTPEAALADPLVLQLDAPGHERIYRALRIARAALDSTVPACNALGDITGITSGHMCRGCPAEGTVCAVQVIRDILAHLPEGTP